MRIITKKGKVFDIEAGSRIVLDKEGGEELKVLQIADLGNLGPMILAQNTEGKMQVVDPISIWDVIEAIKVVVETVKVAVPLLVKIWRFFFPKKE